MRGAEDKFTYNGGTKRPSNRVLAVGSCSGIFALPDGVRQTTRVPSGMRWNGYRRVRTWSGQLNGLQKFVSLGAMRIKVTLHTALETVQCAWLEQLSAQPTPGPCCRGSGRIAPASLGQDSASRNGADPI
jgi:hypothetical protein